MINKEQLLTIKDKMEKEEQLSPEECEQLSEFFEALFAAADTVVELINRFSKEVMERFDAVLRAMPQEFLDMQKLNRTEPDSNSGPSEPGPAAGAGASSWLREGVLIAQMPAGMANRAQGITVNVGRNINEPSQIPGRDYLMQRGRMQA